MDEELKQLGENFVKGFVATTDDASLLREIELVLHLRLRELDCPE